MKIKNNKILYSIALLIVFITLYGFIYELNYFGIKDALFYLLFSAMIFLGEALFAFMFIKVDFSFNKDNPIKSSLNYKYTKNIIFMVTLLICRIFDVISYINELSFGFLMGIIWAGAIVQGMNYLLRMEISHIKKVAGSIVLVFLFCFLMFWDINFLLYDW